jgi:hypothetical protein
MSGVWNEKLTEKGEQYMKRVLPLVAAAFMAVPALAAEPAADKPVSQQAGDAWKKIKGYSVEKKDEAVAFGKDLLRDTDAKIGELEAKAASASGEAKAKYEQEIAKLKTVRAETAARLEKMEKATGSAWNEAKRGFADAYSDLQSAYRKALGKFN